MKLIFRISFWSAIPFLMLLATVLPDITMLWIAVALGIAAASEAVIRADNFRRGIGI